MFTNDKIFYWWYLAENFVLTLNYSMFTQRLREKAAVTLHPQPLNSSTNIFQLNHRGLRCTRTPTYRIPMQAAFSCDCHHEVTGCWMASLVQYSVLARWNEGWGCRHSLFFKLLSLLSRSGWLWWRRMVVVVVGGVLLPLLRVTQTSPSSPSPPTLLSVPVR